MGTSVYFNNQRASAEQQLLEDMIIESIKNHGIDVYYIPRSSQSSTDELFGDDPVKTFKKAFKVEMYMETFKDYEGNKEFFSKFGLEVQETARLCIARRTYEKCVMKKMNDGMNHHVPKEGDLVYLPIQYKLMEIKFVEEEKNFFQLGRDSINPYMYSLSMEAFKYNGELLQTGVEEIDRIANKQAVVIDHILQENGIGTYEQYEWVYQGESFETATAKAVVSNWDKPSLTLKLRNIKGNFTTGTIVGSTSGAIWDFESAITMKNANLESMDDNYRIELEDNNYLDFTETNPFGEPDENNSFIPTNTSLPTITGTAKQGKILVADVGSWNSVPQPTYTYQWKRNGVPISGATSWSYLLVVGDVGSTITVTVTAKNYSGSISATSLPTSTVLADNTLNSPSNVSIPVITGTAQQGQTLYSTTGIWNGTPQPTFTYQWNRDGVAISNATNSTYTLVASDVGFVITVTVTGLNSSGSSSATSLPTAIVTELILPATVPVNTVLPNISWTTEFPFSHVGGTVGVDGSYIPNPNTGSILTVDTGTWQGYPTQYSYQWSWKQSNTLTPIQGATSSTYQLKYTDLNKVLVVSVTATNALGSKTVLSVESDVVVGSYEYVIPNGRLYDTTPTDGTDLPNPFPPHNVRNIVIPNGKHSFQQNDKINIKINVQGVGELAWVATITTIYFNGTQEIFGITIDSGVSITGPTPQYWSLLPITLHTGP